MYNRELRQSKRNLKLLLNILATCSHETPSFNISTTTHRGKFPCLGFIIQVGIIGIIGHIIGQPEIVVEDQRAVVVHVENFCRYVGFLLVGYSLD
jgi:hypothetical protein